MPRGARPDPERSTYRHYGAFLLSEPDLICEIVRRWDQHLDVPGCVKMRKINCTGEDPHDRLP